MLLNNNLDRSMILITPITLIALFLGIASGTYGLFDLNTHKEFQR